MKKSTVMFWAIFGVLLMSCSDEEIANVVTLITADDCTELEIMDKSCVAARIMDRLLKM